MAISTGGYLELLRGRAAGAAPRVAVVDAARQPGPRGVVQVQRRPPGRARPCSAAVPWRPAAPRPRPRAVRGRDDRQSHERHDQQQPARARPARRSRADGDGTHARRQARSTRSWSEM